MKGFLEEEFKVRILNLQKEMQINNIDVTLVTSPHNFRYFTGLDSYFWESPTRPWFLLIPQSEDPIAVIPSIGETALKKTWIKKIYTWPSPQPEDEGISILSKCLNSLIKNNANIGCELGQESHLRMSISDFDKLRTNLSDFDFVASQDVIVKIETIAIANIIFEIFIILCF